MAEPDPNPPTPAPTPGPRLEARALALVLAIVLLLAGAVLYLLYARGVFERTQRLVLLADDSDGVSVGMDMSFSGFPVGRVSRITLGDDGSARIHVEVPQRDARWLRVSSVFVIERGLVGGTRIRAYSGVLGDPPLPDGAERRALRGDATAEIPALVASVRDLLANLRAMTDAESPLNQSLVHLRRVTERLQGPRGALGVMLGNEADARRVGALLVQTQALLARLDGLTARADTQVFGDQGLVPATRATVGELQGALADARASLQKLDAVLVQAQAIAGNTRAATEDLGTLRAEVEASLRQVDALLRDVQRRWPFARETELRLP